VSGQSINEGMPEATWCLQTGDKIGPTYLKALYREFETNCFDEQKDRDQRDEHLGVLGPNIRAKTGETIKIFYKNTCSFPNSMHPHGVEYEKHSEGAPYADNDGITDGDVVEPGATWIYIWKARDGLVDDNVKSQMWIYHSHVNEPRDVMTGLLGALIIYSDDSDLVAEDIDEEFTTFFVLFDENESWLFDQNVHQFLGFWPSDTGADALLKNDEFYESNLMHSINGYLFGNLRGLECSEGDKVRWHTASFGNELDGPHSPHWHGNIAKDAQGHNTDTVVLIAGTTKDVTMKADKKGIWLYHCHVHDHIDAGMMTTYEVK
jgi:FtsP/CotA-like multicopper oxidase with cupredoxin domain